MGNVTVNCPLVFATAFVTADQTAGGARFVVENNPQPVAQFGQFIVSEFAFTLMLMAGTGRKTLMAAEFALAPQPSVAAT